MSDISKMLNEMLEPMIKKESPIVARRRRKILKESHVGAAARKKLKQVQQTYKSEEVLDLAQPLAKNEYETSVNEAGEMKFEFGPEVPELVKKRAMEWAKKRGLKAKEASLSKSVTGTEWIVFTKA
jgi:hypothetical protein